ncbi:hypothetical protein HDU67_001271 [Dinochytrium kinnereticum]|nr:hypothetical protein HDU67_001271 [Dinochytrium kinnereticum]
MPRGFGYAERNVVGSSPISKPTGHAASQTKIPRQTNVIHTTIGGLPVKLTTHVPPPPPPEDDSLSRSGPTKFHPLRTLNDQGNRPDLSQNPSTEQPSPFPPPPNPDRRSKENTAPHRSAKDVASATGLDTDSIAQAPPTRLIATSIWSQQVAESTGTFRTMPVPSVSQVQMQQPLLMPHHLYYPGMSDLDVGPESGREEDADRVQSMGRGGRRDGGVDTLQQQQQQTQLADSHNRIEQEGTEESQADVSLYHDPAPHPIPVPMSEHNGHHGPTSSTVFGRFSYPSSMAAFRPHNPPVVPAPASSSVEAVVRDHPHPFLTHLENRNPLGLSNGERSLGGRGGATALRRGGEGGSLIPTDDPCASVTTPAEDDTGGLSFPNATSSMQPDVTRTTPTQPVGITTSDTVTPTGGSGAQTNGVVAPSGIGGGSDRDGQARKVNTLYEIRLERARQAIRDAQEPGWFDLNLLCNAMTSLEKAVYVALGSGAVPTGSGFKATLESFADRSDEGGAKIAVERKDVDSEVGLRKAAANKTTDDIIRSLEERMHRTSILLQEKARVGGGGVRGGIRV